MIRWCSTLLKQIQIIQINISTNQNKKKKRKDEQISSFNIVIPQNKYNHMIKLQTKKDSYKELYV